MSNGHTSLHVYSREINTNERTSLLVLSESIRPETRVLDLGCGSGALGKHLLEERHCRIDGVTINVQEAELAKRYYERVEVANLESCDLQSLFNGQRYDYIVCADVLEHLQAPERILATCKDMLAEGGQLLLSIPNAAYVGLIGELINGDFLYREEGLLDRTHLRFFTRRSLSRFLQQQGWHLQSIDTVERSLPSSEFKTQFDLLPPAVARHLLALPDALTYQFVALAIPGEKPNEYLNPAPGNAKALFTSCVYFGDDDGFDESRKIQMTGVIGEDRQTLRYQLNHLAKPIKQLRLDPADRPGFLRLYAIRLIGNMGETIWQWTDDQANAELLAELNQNGMLLRTSSDGSGTVALLYSDDPWIILPFSPDELLHAQTLEVTLGWPMSADFLAMATSTRKALEVWGTKADQLEQLLRSRDEDLANVRNELISLRDACHTQIAENESLKEIVTQLQSDETIARQKIAELERSHSFRLIKKLGRFKHQIRSKLSMVGSKVEERPTFEQPAPSAPRNTVDIVVPVYKGLEDTRRCLASVLAYPQKTPWRLVVVNDCSPEEELCAWLRDLSKQTPSMILLENQENLGFVGTVNKAMSLSHANDVVLLNSDTEVANDWLDRLVQHADHDPKVASVTPFSNNATICSYPKFCEPNELPAGYTTEQLDSLFAAECAGQALDVPTGVGFCMYISRTALRQVGLFDVENFGKGYGEENDFCCRAKKLGWRNLHALDVFVLHTGGVSFGSSKNQRELAAMETLRRLHPEYDVDVQAFVKLDPARSARQSVDRARICAAPSPKILAVVHNRAGGTLRHVQELADHLHGQAIFLTLSPAGENQVKLEFLSPAESFYLFFRLPDEYESLIFALKWLNVQHAHYHHILGHDFSVLNLPRDIGIRYDFTFHDYYTICPQISLTDSNGRYCGELGIDQCKRCLDARPAPTTANITQWRNTHLPFLEAARYVITPSQDAARRLMKYAPLVRIKVVPHLDLIKTAATPVFFQRSLKDDSILKVIVIGALSQIKGADVLEAVAIEAARRSAPIEFHLVGFGYRELKRQPKAHLTVHGAYDEEDLLSILQWLKPDVIWFPAQWPETYSYTLSAALQSGIPVLSSDLGAFPERLARRPLSWLLPWQTQPDAWLDFLCNIRKEYFLDQEILNSSQEQSSVQIDSEAHGFYEKDYLLTMTKIAF